MHKNGKKVALVSIDNAASITLAALIEHNDLFLLEQNRVEKEKTKRTKFW